MTGSLAFVSARDELLQRLPGIGQVPGREPLPAGETLPQADETFRVIGKAHCAAGMRELGLKIAVFPLRESTRRRRSPAGAWCPDRRGLADRPCSSRERV